MTTALRDGATGQALRYMGECPVCGARINFGAAYAIVDGAPVCYEHTVEGLPVTCAVCGRQFPPAGANRFPVCEGLCWGAWQAFVWGPLRMIENIYIYPRLNMAALRRAFR